MYYDTIEVVYVRDGDEYSEFEDEVEVVTD